MLSMIASSEVSSLEPRHLCDRVNTKSAQLSEWLKLLTLLIVHSFQHIIVSQDIECMYDMYD